MHNPLLWALRHDFRSLAVFIALCAFSSNFLPSSKRLNRWPRLKFCYEFLVDMIAFFSLNWRRRLPSLNALKADSLDRIPVLEVDCSHIRFEER